MQDIRFPDWGCVWWFSAHELEVTTKQIVSSGLGSVAQKGWSGQGWTRHSALLGDMWLGQIAVSPRAVQVASRVPSHKLDPNSVLVLPIISSGRFCVFTHAYLADELHLCALQAEEASARPASNKGPGLGAQLEEATPWGVNCGGSSGTHGAIGQAAAAPASPEPGVAALVRSSLCSYTGTLPGRTPS